MLKSLPESDRPRERLLKNGEEALSTIELLAILLGSGTKAVPVLRLAEELLSRFGNLATLAHATIAELCEVKGIGKAKAMQLKASFTLGMRTVGPSMPPKRGINSPLDAYKIIKDHIAHETQERFIVLLLDVKSRLICQEMVSVGTLTDSLVHPREVFYPAIRHKAATMILAHNHPSGDLSPSPEDLKITRILIKAGRLMGIPVQDHLIVTASGYLSLRQEGSVTF